MRTLIRGFAVIAAAGLLASTTHSAFAQTKAENQLVGIKLWRTFRDVLAKYGQPTRIENGPVTGTAGGAGGGMPAGGGMMMGGGGLPGVGGMGMGGGMMAPAGMGAPMGGGGSGMGARGGGKMGAMGGMGAMGPGGGGMGGGSGLSGGMGGRGMQRRGGFGGEDDPGMGMVPGGGGRMGGGLPGMSGFGLGSGGGLGGPMGGGGASAPEGEGEVTWVYERPGGLTYMFLFNKDGRVIQIQEFGYRGGQPTTRGVGLGDPVHKVYGVYGWAGSAVKDGNNLTLDYSNKQHVAFQLLSSGKGAKVVGITVAITELGQAAGSQ